MPRFLLAPAVAIVVLIATAESAAAVYSLSNPYTGQGYDTSSYQCSAASVVPAGYSFGVVRVTGGRPFSLDSCRQNLWNQAQYTGKPSLYENVAYSKAYAHQVPTQCLIASPEAYQGAARQAWQIGCTESLFASTYEPTGGANSVAAWWLDVETGNSWSTSNLTLNQAAIDGAVDELRALIPGSVPVGIYSNASSWTTIVTGTSGAPWAPQHASGSWVAGFSSCGHPFSPLPEWLYQYQTTSWGADADFACP